jgi:hypothetical protein
MTAIYDEIYMFLDTPWLSQFGQHMINFHQQVQLFVFNDQ